MCELGFFGWEWPKLIHISLEFIRRILFKKCLSEVYWNILQNLGSSLFFSLSPHILLSCYSLVSFSFFSFASNRLFFYSLLHILGLDHPVLIQFQKYPGWSHSWPPTEHSTSLTSFLNHSTFLDYFPAWFFSIACFIWHTKYLFILLNVLFPPSECKLCEELLCVLVAAISPGPGIVSDIALNK